MEDTERWQFYLEISQITSHPSWELPLIVGNVYVQDKTLPEKKLEDYVEKVRVFLNYFFIHFLARGSHNTS